MAHWDKLLSLLLLCSSLVYPNTDLSFAANNVRLCLALHDTKGAYLGLEQLRKTTGDFVDNPEVLALAFDYLAEVKDIEGLKILWEKARQHGITTLPPETVEKIAWVTIEASSTAYHPKLRAEALLAAAESRDVRGVYILKQMLLDPHQGIQQMALQLSVHYPDAVIQQRAEEIAYSGSPDAKLAAAMLLAAQKAPCAEAVLTAMLLDETLSEDDLVDIASLIAHLKENVDLDWVQKAASEQRPPLRALAASSVRTCPSPEGLRLLLPLLKDPSMGVRKCAFQTLGLWQSLIPDASEQLLTVWRQELHSPSLALCSTAAWCLLLSPDKSANQEAAAWFEEMLLSSSKERSLIASSRLIKSGEQGLALAKSLLPKMKEPLPTVNLAFFLLIHRHTPLEASEALRRSLPSTLLGDYADGLFSWIGSSSLGHHPAIPRLPESQDLLIRLQLLALQRYSGAPIPKEEIEAMLNDRAFGVCAEAASFLIQEFAHSLDDVLSPLLSHETEGVRIQAALLLTLISKSKHAAEILAEQYEKASKEGKETLLLGFSILPPSKTMPYLLNMLFDGSSVLRTRAAGALIASMYR